MALMKFREKNQADWFGVRPAHLGTQIAKSVNATNETKVLYTVTAGKVLHLVASLITSMTATGSKGRLYIRDDADADWFELGMTRIAPGTWPSPCWFQPFIPLEIPAGYDIVLVAATAAAEWSASVFGWEE